MTLQSLGVTPLKCSMRDLEKWHVLDLLPSFAVVSAEMYEIQRGCSYLAVQAADPVYSQPEPEGCTQLWPISASLQRQGWQVSGWGETAKGIPLPIHCTCTLPGGRYGSCVCMRQCVGRREQEGVHVTTPYIICLYSVYPIILQVIGEKILSHKIWYSWVSRFWIDSQTPKLNFFCH